MAKRSETEIAEPVAWHALSVGETLGRLKSHRDGLSAAEAAARLERYGPNTLPQAPRRHPVVRFLAQFNNVLVYLLIVAGVITASSGHYADSAVIVKARIKTVALQQWSTGREFNRRLKMAFDEKGIEIPFPQRTLHFQGTPPKTD